jgi:hypothetical protein
MGFFIRVVTLIFAVLIWGCATEDQLGQTSVVGTSEDRVITRGLLEEGKSLAEQYCAKHDAQPVLEKSYLIDRVEQECEVGSWAAWNLIDCHPKKIGTDTIGVWKCD